MATVLLLVIYIAFIGLGIPDSLFGTAWPAIYPELGLPISTANFVTTTMSLCSCLSSFISARVINRFGTGAVTSASTVMTALALLGFSLSGNLWCMCLLAVPLGLGAGTIDAALNNYVALHYKATHMNFLHCAYGIGVSASPFLMSLFLGQDHNWRGGYRAAFWIQLGIAAVVIMAIPLWRKAAKRNTSSEKDEPQQTVSILRLARRRDIRADWLIFIGSCGLEFTCGIWGSSFLVNSRGMSVDLAARMVMFYYMGIAISRFLSGLLSVKLTPWKLVHLSQTITLIALILLLFLPSVGAGVAMLCIGLGNGALFPNMTHLTPIHFGRSMSQSVVSSQMAMSNIGVLAFPLVFGFLAQWIGTWLYPYYLLFCYGIMMFGTLRLIRILKQQKRYDLKK